MVIPFLALLIGGVVYPPNDLYVAVSGSDSNPGSLVAPWQTIAKVNASATSGKKVHFRGGDRFYGTLQLKSATDYDSYGTGRAVISGGQQVTTWTQTSIPKNIWRATWNAGRPRSLWVNGTRVVRARTTTGLPSGSTATSTDFSTAASSNPGYLSTWGNQADIQFVFLYDWTNSYANVASVSGNTITMDAVGWPNLYNIQSIQGHPQLPNYIENAYEIFDANASAGSFYQDRTAGFIYLIPPIGVSNPNSATVIAPVLQEIATASSQSNITVSNLEFSHSVNTDANAIGWAEVQSNTGGSAGAKVKIKPTIHLLDCTNVNFTRNVIRYLGTAGICPDGVSTSCTFDGNIIYDISSVGIQLGDVNQIGVGSVTSGISVNNNFVALCGQEFTGGPGIIQWWANGNTVTHNEIYRQPYTGISAGWGWGLETTPNGNSGNVLSYNLIHSIMQLMNDGGGIYCNSHNPTAAVNHNYVYDLGNGSWIGSTQIMSGFYLDDGCQGYAVSDNVVSDFTNRAYLFHNNIDSNVMTTNRTSTGGGYDVFSGPLTVAPNTYDTLIVLSNAAARVAGQALGAGLQSAYADVYAEAHALVP